ncbi:hypothetical protein M422DRAFT_142687, partial [Sphaerobolus stellatus SS14]
PFKQEWVDQILKEVNIGEDLSNEQCTEVVNLVTEFADVFALTLAKVLLVNFTTHKLHINPSIPLPTKVNQKPLMAEQKLWYYRKIEEMEEAGIIAHVKANQVR